MTAGLLCCLHLSYQAFDDRQQVILFLNKQEDYKSIKGAAICLIHSIFG